MFAAKDLHRHEKNIFSCRFCLNLVMSNSFLALPEWVIIAFTESVILLEMVILLDLVCPPTKFRDAPCHNKIGPNWNSCQHYLANLKYNSSSFVELSKYFATY